VKTYSFISVRSDSCVALEHFVTYPVGRGPRLHLKLLDLMSCGAQSCSFILSLSLKQSHCVSLCEGGELTPSKTDRNLCLHDFFYVNASLFSKLLKYSSLQYFFVSVFFLFALHSRDL